MGNLGVLFVILLVASTGIAQQKSIPRPGSEPETANPPPETAPSPANPPPTASPPANSPTEAANPSPANPPPANSPPANSLSANPPPANSPPANPPPANPPPETAKPTPKTDAAQSGNQPQPQKNDAKTSNAISSPQSTKTDNSSGLKEANPPSQTEVPNAGTTEIPGPNTTIPPAPAAKMNMTDVDVVDLVMKKYSPGENPDTFIFSRLEERGGLITLLQTEPLVFYDKKIAFSYRYLIREDTCNFTEFQHMMPDFWTDYFQGTGDLAGVQKFGNYYWNISVEFLDGVDEVTVEGHCQHAERVDQCTVQRKPQLEREKDLCFAGGLLECSEENTCVCLESYGTKTVRVNSRTGKPDPNGVACFVEEGYPCLIKHFGMADLNLPCVSPATCDPYSGNCLKHSQVY